MIIGEVGLGGEVRGVQKLQNRLKEVISLGFKRVVIPKGGKKLIKDSSIEFLEVATVDEAINKLLI